MSEHSPLPWRLVSVFDQGDKIVDDDGRTVLHCPVECTDLDRANLALIVERVNGRDGMDGTDGTDVAFQAVAHLADEDVRQEGAA